MLEHLRGPDSSADLFNLKILLAPMRSCNVLQKRFSGSSEQCFKHGSQPIRKRVLMQPPASVRTHALQLSPPMCRVCPIFPE